MVLILVDLLGWLILLGVQGMFPPVDGYATAHMGRPGSSLAAGPLLAAPLGAVLKPLLSPAVVQLVFCGLLVAVPLYSVWLISRIWTTDHDRLGGPTLTTCLVVVLALGAITILNLTYLSNDAYLYRCQGQMLSQLGRSPYLACPAEVLPAGELAHVPWTVQKSCYGPLAVLLFAAATTVTSSVVGQFWILKAALALPWLGMVGYTAMTRRLAPHEKTKWLAWVGLSPLSLLEICQNSHLEGWMGALLLLGALALSRPTVGRAALAGLLLGLACTVKLTAAVAGPVMLAWLLWPRGRRRPGALALGAQAAALTVGALVPLAALGGLFWEGPATLVGLREESGKVLRSVYSVLGVMGVGHGAIMLLSLAGNIAAIAAGIWVVRRMGNLPAGLMACFLVQAVAGRTFLQPWYFCVPVILALGMALPADRARPVGLRRPAGIVHAKVFCSVLILSASAVGGAYVLPILLNIGLPSTQALSLGWMVLPPAVAWLLWRADPYLSLGPSMRSPAPGRPQAVPGPRPAKPSGV